MSVWGDRQTETDRDRQTDRLFCTVGCLWVCLASVSGPVCVFVFVIRVTA